MIYKKTVIYFTNGKRLTGGNGGFSLGNISNDNEVFNCINSESNYWQGENEELNISMYLFNDVIDFKNFNEVFKKIENESDELFILYHGKPDSSDFKSFFVEKKKSKTVLLCEQGHHESRMEGFEYYKYLKLFLDIKAQECYFNYSKLYESLLKIYEKDDVYENTFNELHKDWTELNWNDENEMKKYIKKRNEKSNLIFYK